MGKALTTVVRFSPHTRGCSACLPLVPPIMQVFPAYAGMFRQPWRNGMVIKSFPRIRGDVPVLLYGRPGVGKFSPHTRGCSALVSAAIKADLVFPAYAGMFRRSSTMPRPDPSFPRIRGDVPGQLGGMAGANLFSPHTRGCSRATLRPARRRQVFPAYAGMFRFGFGGYQGGFGFPRIRGDVPEVKHHAPP